MSDSFFIGSWQKIRPLGTGGQGDVWLTRSLAAADRRKAAVLELSQKLRGIVQSAYSANEQTDEVTRVVDLIGSLSAEDSRADLGAAKVFNSAIRSSEQAMRRLEKEIEVLKAVEHPAVIQMLDSDVGSRILVTEYHSGGTLAGDGSRFRGDVLASLRAIRGLVDGVRKIHELGAIHRDIKPQNILIASDGRLVLADFGIVFFADAEKTRITNTVGERVGPSDWMAPWANTDSRIPLEELRPTFDLYSIGKVLWSMVSGRRVLPYWWWDKPSNNLEGMFSNKSEMVLANDIIARVVVEDEKGCCSDARVLLESIDNAIARLERGGSSLHVRGGWPCRVCGVGMYEPSFLSRPGGKMQLWPFDTPAGGEIRLLQVQPFHCGFCGHTEFIQLRNMKLAEEAWKA